MISDRPNPIHGSGSQGSVDDRVSGRVRAMIPFEPCVSVGRPLQDMKSLGLLLLATIVAAEQRYDGYEVLRFYPETHEDLAFLAELRKDNRLDFWTEIRRPTTDVMVPPSMMNELQRLLSSHPIAHDTMIPDVQKLVDLQRAGMPEDGSPRAMSWDSYHRLSDIHDYLDELAASYPDLVTVFSIGESFEGRDLKMIKISSGVATQKIWIDAGIHAREWIAPATATYIIRELVENYDANKDIVDTFDWYIFPAHNPDGYEYTHTNVRSPGASDDPCSDIFAGPEPFSESETAAVESFLIPENADGSFQVFLTVHSYSQVWLSPWSWTLELPVDYDDLRELGEIAITALAEVHGTEYEFGATTEIFYFAPGPSDDWAKGAAGIKYAYTIELRDTGTFGFLLPPEQIIPTGEETWAAVAAVARFFQ
ncbi:unnamed protein product [Darwinula stevensoni]|uniref:Zinc carboxypeptidase A 1 n=1 Tax=Darwinula stevensoni TaxID=69355 RepID=A0A7R8X7E1_9CRUS|nr:unnamed protein product [Darwinula stevensoni]CAG0886878.1 unnamed protein product [Darwinula stevensoni]